MQLQVQRCRDVIMARAESLASSWRPAADRCHWASLLEITVAERATRLGANEGKEVAALTNDSPGCSGDVCVRVVCVPGLLECLICRILAVLLPSMM